MNKVLLIIKKTLKAVIWVVISFVLILVIILLVLRIPSIQSKVADYAASFISKKTNTSVEIGKINIAFLKSVEIEGIYLDDLSKDTLFYTGSVGVNISLRDLVRKHLHVVSFSLEDGVANLHRSETDSLFNYNFFLTAFGDTAGKVKPGPEKESNWIITIDNVSLKKIRVKYIDKYSGMHAAADLSHLDLKMNNMDLAQSVFDINSLLLDGLNAELLITRFTEKEVKKDKSVLPVITAKSIIINNAELNYDDSTSKQALVADISKFRFIDVSADLQRQTVNSDSLYLSESTIRFNTIAPDSSSLPVTGPDTLTGKSNFAIAVNNIDLDNNSISYHVGNKKKVGNTFDANHLEYSKLSLSLKDMYFSPDSTRVAVNNFTAVDQNDFLIKHFQTKFRMDQHSISAENLKLQTSHSSIDADLNVKYSSLESLKDSISTMILNVDVKNLSVRNSDIVYFNPALSRIDFFKNKKIITSVSGSLSGPVNDLSGKNLVIETGNRTSLKTDFNIRGLPAIETADFNIKELKIYSGRDDLIMLAGSSIPAAIELPTEISLEGSFTGSMNSFESEINLYSSFGAADINAAIDQNENFNGRITVSGFDLGRLLKDTSMFGPVTLVAETNGYGRDLNTITADLKFQIPDILLNNYTYHNLSLNGTVTGRQFEGSINLDDENAEFDLNALVNLTPDQEHYKIDLNLFGADLQKLNFTKDDMKVGFVLNSDIRGNPMSEMNGRAGISSILISHDGEHFNIDSVTLALVNEPGHSELNISSPVIDINYAGTVFPAELGELSARFLNEYFSVSDTFSEPEEYLAGQGMTGENQNFTFGMQFYDHPILHEVLVPQLTEFIPGPVTGSFDSENNELKFNAAIKKIVFGTTVINDLSVDINSDVNVLNYKVSAGTISNAQVNLDNFLVEGELADNQITTTVSSIDENRDPKLLIRSLITRDNDNYRISFNPENFWLMNNRWNFSAGNYILFGKNGFLIHDLTISKTGSEISVASVNDMFNDDLKINVRNFSLEDISGIIERDTALVKGIVDGNILLKKSDAGYGIIADAAISDLFVKEAAVGNLKVLAENPSANRFDFDVNLSGEENNVQVIGYFVTKGDDKPVNAKASIRSLSMETVKAFSMGALTEASGSLTGDLVVAGSISAPVITGSIVFNNVYVTPAALNNRLHLVQETVQLKEDGIYFDSFDILDQDKNTASVNGSVTMNNFKDLAFALQVNAKDFLLFNTTKEDNESFFGRLIIDTELGITGPMTLPVVSAKLKMKKDSYFTFAVPEKKLSADRGEAVVEFEGPELRSPILATDKGTQETGITGFDITSVIEIDEEATLRVLLDPATNDSLVVKGEAALSFAIDPSGKMSLTGVYNVNEGSYLVSLESLIKREFNIKKGSTIIWNGDPMDADISIDAGYSVRAAPIDLVADQLAGMSQTDQNMYKQRYPFEVLLKLRGEILSPEISFDIQLAPEDKGIFGGSVNAKLTMLNEDPSALNKQVFALLVLGRFVQENPFQTDAASSTVRSTVGKFLSEQLNQWSSKLVPGVELNFDIQSYNDYQSGQAEGRTQLDVGVKKQLFNERLSVQVEGVVDVEGEKAKQNNASDITSDVTVEYKLTEDGRFRLRGFRHNTYEGAIEGQIVETGAGVKYVREFNRWKYLFRKRGTDPLKKMP